jgi:hypothetical protein
VLAVDEGMLPSWAYGVGVAAGVRLRGLRLMLAGLLWLPQKSDTTPSSPFAVSYERRSGELSGCYAWTNGRFEVGPCLTVTLEDVTAGGSGPQVAGGPGHVDWLTVGIAARGEWSFSGWGALFLRPSLTLNTSRPTFAIDGVGPLYQVPLATVGVEVGCEWIL